MIAFFHCCICDVDSYLERLMHADINEKKINNEKEGRLRKEVKII